MGVTVRLLSGPGVVEMVVAGALTSEELDAGVRDSARTGAEHGTSRYLVDCRAQLAAGTSFDILALAQYFASMPPGFIEREALVLPTDAAAADQIEFFETACRNRGLEVRVFHDYDQALIWVGAQAADLDWREEA